MSAVFEAVGTSEETPTTVHTTLYDLMSAMYDVAEPGDEALVVPSMLHLLRTGRVAFLRAPDDLTGL
jgi:hypothetical protein